MNEEQTSSHAPGDAGQALAVEVLNRARQQIDDYLAGYLTAFDLPLTLAGTNFQRCVWQGLLQIPYGQTLSYAELARRIGHPGKARAVGQANRANPIGLIVPCHRVIAADGSLGGYAGGVELKRSLLNLESSAVRPSLFARSDH